MLCKTLSTVNNPSHDLTFSCLGCNWDIFYCVYYSLHVKHETTVGMMQGCELSVKSYQIINVNKQREEPLPSHSALTSVSAQTVLLE